ncbi:hypothetical protein L6164_035019 [Bauhinia variegata]|uniref:Uncharacterized protein n=1 Tax=Bauhinia variegata TaxID=167791 RepID=A0ACB9KWN1_BAUVA|nr:hypothetical protein L6164_035019 [Bauhinia variegata]
MDFGHIILAVIGFSTSFFLCVPNLKRWHTQQIATQKLRMINEALEVAEERVARFQERHDRILSEICESYLTNTELVDALASARTTTREALEFAVDLRRIQLKAIASFPEVVTLDTLLIKPQEGDAKE